MCSEFKLSFALVFLCICSCSPVKRLESIRTGEVGMSISVPDEKPLQEEDETDVEVLVDSIRSTLADEPFIMKAIRDTETGEMVATDVINASTVTARFRNVAERLGYVSISFDVNVPAAMADSRWQLKLNPSMSMLDDTVALEPIYITGSDYREMQLRGYERYRRFLATIIEDSTFFIKEKQLEIFLKRHFPQTYAMKNDSSYVSEPEAKTLFGTTQAEALQHYTMKMRKRINDRRKSRKGEMFGRYVRDPIMRTGVRLDTVVNEKSGDFIYRYTHTFKSRPFLKKVVVNIDGSLYEDGREISSLPMPEDLTFYISSLATLADETPRYRMLILERRAYDNTKAFLDFTQGSCRVDTSLGDNASELRRIKECINDVAAKEDFALDSLLIVASCSPEGTWTLNKKLSRQRSEAVKDYLMSYVPEDWQDSVKTSVIPENWVQLDRLVRNDTVLSVRERQAILTVMEDDSDLDKTEYRLSKMPSYRYLREKLYPRLRSVSFDFYLHRIGMVKDTVHTMEIDSVYMSGVEALKHQDYKKAVSLLRPYRDYNSALALMSADYNHTALDVLKGLDDGESKVCYLKAIVMSRLGLKEEALKYFELGVSYDPAMEYRANLDPELYEILKLRKNKNRNYD